MSFVKFLSWIGLVVVLAASGCTGAPASLAPALAAAISSPTHTGLPTASPTAPFATAEQPSQAPTQPVITSPSPETPTGQSSPTAGSGAAATATPFPNASDCTHLVGFYGDLTIPDGTQMAHGQAFTKSWRVRNEGSCTWGAGYRLVFAGGELLGGPMAQELPAAAPGEVIDISIELTAPQVGGSFTGNWQFQDPQGRAFATGFTGNIPLWVTINTPFFNATSAASGASTAAVEQSTALPGQPTATPVSSGQGGTGCQAARDSAVESQVLSLINQARSQNGLSPLTLSSELSAAALGHSLDMACQDFVSHTGSDGSTWYARVTAAGYSNPALARENLYVGNPAFGGTAQGALTWWMNSPIHRDNILFANVTEIGIAYVYNPASTYGGYYTTIFGRP